MQIPQLTFLRFLAAVGVVFFHFGQETWPFHTAMFLPAVKEAGLGVGFFFTLSGFVLAWVYSGQERLRMGTYFRARLARIAPLYLLAFGVTLFLEMVVRGTRPRGFSILLQGLGLQAWVPGYSLAINFPGWSVSVELFFYALFPLLFLWLRGKPRGFLVGFGTLIFLINFWICLNIGRWTQGIVEDPMGDLGLRFPLFQLHAFLTGMVGGLIFYSGGLHFKNPKIPGALFLLLSLGLLSLSYFENPIIRFGPYGLLFPWFLGIILTLSQTQGFIQSFFSNKIFVFLGEVSFAIYLFQAPVYIAFEPIAKIWSSRGIAGFWFYVYLVLLLAISSLIHVWFERPLRDRIRKAA